MFVSFLKEVSEKIRSELDSKNLLMKFKIEFPIELTDCYTIIPLKRKNRKKRKRNFK